MVLPTNPVQESAVLSLVRKVVVQSTNVFTLILVQMYAPSYWAILLLSVLLEGGF